MQPSSNAKTLTALNSASRAKLFGRFDFEPKPLPDNRENIVVKGSWAKENLVTIPLGALAPAKGADQATFHRLVAPRVQELIEEWDRLGIAQDVLSWNGSYCARFVRGTKRQTLSAHSWGSAFDLNVPWNPLGRDPAGLGQTGTVLRLVPVAEKLGFFWGGRFSRRDAMHFELARL